MRVATDDYVLEEDEANHLIVDGELLIKHSSDDGNPTQPDANR